LKAGIKLFALSAESWLMSWIQFQPVSTSESKSLWVLVTLWMLSTFCEKQTILQRLFRQTTRNYFIIPIMEGRYTEYAGIIWNIYFQAWNTNKQLLEKWHLWSNKSCNNSFQVPRIPLFSKINSCFCFWHGKLWFSQQTRPIF
jgi:hypothetical protein